MSGFLRILDVAERPPSALVRQFAALATPHLSDSMQRLYAAGPRIRPMHREGKLAGVAFTVRTAPGDNLLVHKALDMAHPGDVIVIDAGGALENAIVGQLMCTHARKRGLAGVVVWGAIRDYAEIAADGFPVFAAGVTNRGPFRNGPGETNVPVIMGATPVSPGDIVVGDCDGLVAIPQGAAERVLEAAKDVAAKEAISIKKFRDGSADRSWVDKALREKGYQIPPGREQDS